LVDVPAAIAVHSRCQWRRQSDGPAKVVLDGFTVARDNYHNFANGLRFGPDGWLYGRCGHSCPGRIGVPAAPDANRIPIEGGIWRFHPEHKVFEAICHGTVNPWGHDWDENGELFFINTVIGHLWHAIPGAHFKESFGESSNPAIYERLDMIADHYHYDTTGSWTASRDGKANDLGGGHAHIGMMIYQADRWPERYHNKLFTLNMHGQRANVERLERQGAGYVGRHEPDFCISADPFFRGLEISVGPRGNAYVLDWSDTGECHEHTGVHRTSGRIYKVGYGEEADRKASQETPDVIDKPACMGGSGKLPELWRQYQAGQTTPQQLRELLRDRDEHLRVWAIRLLTDLWPLDTIVGPRAGAVYPDDPASRAAFVRMAREDSSGLVHLTLASTLQRLPVKHRADLAMELVKHDRHAEDRDLPALVWCGLIPVSEHNAESLVSIARNCRWPKTLRWIARNLASRIESNPQALDALLTAAVEMQPNFQENMLLGMSDAFRGWRQAPQPSGWGVIAGSEAASKNPGVIRELSILFGDGRAMDEIREIALSGAMEIKTRQAALQTLVNARPADLREVCESLLNVRVLNAAAAQGLALYDDPAIGQSLAKNYRRFHPDDRPKLLEILVSRRSFAKSLLDQVSATRNPIPRSDITAFHARQIRGLGDDALTDQLTDVWGALRDSPADRKAEIGRWREKLSRETLSQADLSAGRALFKKTCAQCHMLYGDGEKIGPDLTGSQRSSLEYVLENVLDPSAVVGKDYRMTIVMTDDGRILNGLVVSEDDMTLVLQTQTKKETLPIEFIEQTRNTTLSPMPDGLLSNLSDDQVRDLIAYLMHPSQVPLPSQP
jgi:putative membrane-bound dehydrogenase-like protein